MTDLVSFDALEHELAGLREAAARAGEAFACLFEEERDPAAPPHDAAPDMARFAGLLAMTAVVLIAG